MRKDSVIILSHWVWRLSVPGEVKSLSFDMTGDDYKAGGQTTLVYDDLKMELLKKDSGELVKKGFMSFIANALMKNSNAGKEKVKPVTMTFTRDTTKSFFNLVWKTIFEGDKKYYSEAIKKAGSMNRLFLKTPLNLSFVR